MPDGTTLLCVALACPDAVLHAPASPYALVTTIEKPEAQANTIKCTARAPASRAERLLEFHGHWHVNVLTGRLLHLLLLSARSGQKRDAAQLQQLLQLLEDFTSIKLCTGLRLEAVHLPQSHVQTFTISHMNFLSPPRRMPCPCHVPDHTFGTHHSFLHCSLRPRDTF